MNLQYTITTGAIDHPAIVEHFNKAPGSIEERLRTLAQWSDILSSLRDFPEVRYAIMNQLFGIVPTAERHQIYTELGRIRAFVRDLPAGAELSTK